MTLLPTKSTLEYVEQFGGRCRDCADEGGVCPNTGLPCAEKRKAILWVIGAINYGVAHGFLKVGTSEDHQPVSLSELEKFFLCDNIEKHLTRTDSAGELADAILSRFQLTALTSGPGN